MRWGGEGWGGGVERWDTRHVYGHATTLYLRAVGIERTHRPHLVCVHKAAHPPSVPKAGRVMGLELFPPSAQAFRGAAGEQRGGERGEG